MVSLQSLVELWIVGRDSLPTIHSSYQSLEQMHWFEAILSKDSYCLLLEKQADSTIVCKYMINEDQSILPLHPHKNGLCKCNSCKACDLFVSKKIKRLQWWLKDIVIWDVLSFRGDDPCLPEQKKATLFIWYS